MNMKKTIAGLVASVVAISAMATTMVSAKEFETYTVKTETTTTVEVTGIVNVAGTAVVIGSTTVLAKNVEVTALTRGATAVAATALKAYAPITGGTAAVVDDPATTTVDETAAAVPLAITVNTTGLKTGDPVVVSLKVKGTATATAFTVSNIVGDALIVADTKTTTTKNYPALADPNNKGTMETLAKGLTIALANEIAANTNGTLTFKFIDLTEKTDDAGVIIPPVYGQSIDFGGVSAKDFGVMFNETGKLSVAGDVDFTAGTITFKIADILAASNITNTTGLITSIQYEAKASLAKFGISSVTVEASAVTDPSTPDASTPGTDDGNPKTGNAPIALAIIPVALAAAAIVASKKRA